MFNENIKYFSKEVTVTEIIRGEPKEVKTIMICVLNNFGVYLPSIATEFIKSRYEFTGKSLNSLDMPARTVCKFLNFCIDKIKEGNEEFLHLKEDGFKGLTRLHGSRFISELSLNGLQRSTVTQYEKYLSSFFVYLKNTHRIKEQYDLEVVSSKKGIYKSVFRDPTLPTRLPSRNTISKKRPKLKDFGKDRIYLTNLFINVSQDVAPEISLALCFMFFGGLRRGEIVNLSTDSLVVNANESLEVRITDNREKFFSRLKDTKAENPKRLNYLNLEMCRQTILDNALVWSIYDKHMKQLDIHSKNNFLKIDNALFVDTEGFPMSGRVFEKHFLKVKKIFLEIIKEHPDFHSINSGTWNTHIGRGVFTNMLIDFGFTPTQLAIARGDRNINSAMSYIDKSITDQQITEAVDLLKDIHPNKLGIIDKVQLEKIKEVGAI